MIFINYFNQGLSQEGKVNVWVFFPSGIHNKKLGRYWLLEDFLVKGKKLQGGGRTSPHGE